MASEVRKSRVKEVPLSEVKDDLSRYLREAESHEILITRHGKPAGVLIGFASENDWLVKRHPELTPGRHLELTPWFRTTSPTPCPSIEVESAPIAAFPATGSCRHGS